MLSNVSTSSSGFFQIQSQLKTASAPKTKNTEPATATAQTQSSAAPVELLPSQRVALAAAPATTQTQSAINTLKKPPFKPTDINMFSSRTYPAGSPMKLAPKKSMTSLEVKAQLTKTFTKRFNGNKTKIKEAISLMDSPSLKKYVPDPKLRGAIVNLKGTAGEPAIDAYRKGAFGIVKYKTLKADDQGIAYVMSPPGKTKDEVWVNDRYQGEDFRLLTKTMAHEALHHDQPNSPTEELVNGAIDTLIYAKQILEDPTLATRGTELPRRQNAFLLARLNSRDKAGNLRLFQAQGSSVTPGGVNVKNYADVNANSPASPAQATSTPGNAVLRAMLKNVTGKTVPTANFDGNTLKLLDQGQKLLTPVELVNLARILKLNIK